MYPRTCHQSAGVKIRLYLSDFKTSFPSLSTSWGDQADFSHLIFLRNLMNVLIFTAPALPSTPASTVTGSQMPLSSSWQSSETCLASPELGPLTHPSFCSYIPSLSTDQSCLESSKSPPLHLSKCLFENIVKSEYSPSSSFWNKYYVKVSPTPLPFPSSPHTTDAIVSCFFLAQLSGVFFISILILIYLEPIYMVWGRELFLFLPTE